MPRKIAAMTKASQPKTAVFQWLALQRPIRAARLFECLRGDIFEVPFSRSCVHPTVAPTAPLENAGAASLTVRVTEPGGSGGIVARPPGHAGRRGASWGRADGERERRLVQTTRCTATSTSTTALVRRTLRTGRRAR